MARLLEEPSLCFWKDGLEDGLGLGILLYHQSFGELKGLPCAVHPLSPVVSFVASGPEVYNGASDLCPPNLALF